MDIDEMLQYLTGHQRDLEEAARSKQIQIAKLERETDSQVSRIRAQGHTAALEASLIIGATMALNYSRQLLVIDRESLEHTNRTIARIEEMKLAGLA
jgi:hypothetical protein